MNALPPPVGVSPAAVWQRCPGSAPVAGSPWPSPGRAVTSGPRGWGVSAPSSSLLVL